MHEPWLRPTKRMTQINIVCPGRDSNALSGGQNVISSFYYIYYYPYTIGCAVLHEGRR